MKKLLITFVLIACGILLGYLIHLDSGYIAIYYSNYSIETSLWVGLTILALSFVILYLLIRFCSHLFHLTQYFKTWAASRSASKHQKLSQQGITQYAQKDWKQAEKSLSKAANLGPSLENHINAAKAAQHQGAYKRRDEHLQTAYNQIITSRPAILIIQANLQLEAQQFDQAIATLSYLLQGRPQDKTALSLLHQAYKIIGDWKALHELLPALRKHKAIPTTEINLIEEDLALLELTSAAKQPNITGIQVLWNTFSKHLQTQPRVLNHYIKSLIQYREYDSAYFLIEKSLNKNWSPTLVALYALIKTDNKAKLLSNVEKWLRYYPRDEDLLFTLAKIALSASFYPKAKEYIKRLTDICPTKKSWNLFADIYEAQNQLPDAIACYKKAILFKK